MRTGMMKAKMNTQIFSRVSQYQEGCSCLRVTAVEAMNITGNPMAEERIQLQTLTILALRGVLKSSALTGLYLHGDLRDTSRRCKNRHLALRAALPGTGGNFQHPLLT
ncbi:hypothetical protein INR49_007748, partial [Caranx melampygus]